MNRLVREKNDKQCQALLLSLAICIVALSLSLKKYDSDRNYINNGVAAFITTTIDLTTRLDIRSTSAIIPPFRVLQRSDSKELCTIIIRTERIVPLFALRSLDATNSLSSSDDDNRDGTTTKRNNNTKSKNATMSTTTIDASLSTQALVPTTTPTTTTVITTSGLKLRRLKDMMWIRETLEDLTAAEFACTVEAATTTTTNDNNNNNNDTKNSKKIESTLSSLRPKIAEAVTNSKLSKSTKLVSTTTPTISRPRKRAVDYEKLLRQLNQRLRDLGCSSDMDKNDINDEEDMKHQYKLEPNVGMGTLTYTETQRNALLDRIVRTRSQLIEIIHGNQIEMSDTESIPAFLQKNLPSLPRMEIPKEDVGEDVLSPKLYVRDDGSVDWDGALSSGAALRQFGTAVWARINGRETTDSIEESDESDGSIVNSNNVTTAIQLHGTSTTQVTAKIVETDSIIEARETLNELRDQLHSMEREHYKLLNSVISQGQATANVKLATLAPKVRGEIQASAAALENIKMRVSFQTLLYELERIYTYLMGELGNPSLNGYIPLQDRLNVAEFGLLESQVDTFNRQFMENDTVDEDVLAVVFEQLSDFKRRLGIDYYVAGLSFDREAIGAWLGDLWVKTKKGLAFYVKGVRLFWNDVVFCLRLINRAAQGYTLKPREVRTIRRTFKDVITFIPFVIILLIPLSPIGHVLVFGAIQRFFPDFFPSCFTEQRQNLLQLYETAEYSELVINENWNAKLSRIAVAMAYVVADAFRTLFLKITGGLRRQEMSDENDKK